MGEFQYELDKLLKAIEVTTTIEEDPYIQEYDIAEELREMIIQRRDESNLTQKQLAQKSGISQANISKIERGSSIPNIYTLKKIADAMGYRLVIDFIPEEEE